MALRTFSLPDGIEYQTLKQVRLQVTCSGFPDNTFTLDVSTKARIHVLSGIPWETSCTLRRICDGGVSGAPLSFRTSRNDSSVSHANIFRFRPNALVIRKRRSNNASHPHATRDYHIERRVRFTLNRPD